VAEHKCCSYFFCPQVHNHVQNQPPAPLHAFSRSKGRQNLKTTPVNFIQNNSTKTFNVKSTLFEKPQTSSFL
jgi:hypothetical protein